MHSFDWGEISYFDFDISNSFDALRKLNSNQEKSLSESKKELEDTIKSIRDYNKDGEEEFIEAYIHHRTYDNEIMIDEIQRLQRYSLVMSIFAFYEARLKSICNMVEREFQFKIKVSDLNNYKGDLVKYWTYLAKVYEMPIVELQHLFEPINFQKKIRNLIAHHDGIATEKNIREIPETEGISFRKNAELYFLQIEANVYVEFLLKSLNLFFESLLKAIDKRYTELKSK